MKKLPLNKILVLLTISVLTVFTYGCSSDESEAPKTEKAASAPKAVNNNNVDSGEASDTAKQKFEKVFAQNCVKRELKTSVNKDVDEKRFQDSCSCIANHIAEDLAEVDAEKYLDDHEDTHTLQIKFDAAAFFCVQNKAQPKGPHLFGK
jgi:hypothetical protein